MSSEHDVKVKLTYDPAAGSEGYWSARVEIDGEYVGSCYWQSTKQAAIEAAQAKAQRFIDEGGVHEETVTL